MKKKGCVIAGGLVLLLIAAVYAAGAFGAFVLGGRIG